MKSSTLMHFQAPLNRLKMILIEEILINKYSVEKRLASQQNESNAKFHFDLNLVEFCSVSKYLLIIYLRWHWCLRDIDLVLALISFILMNCTWKSLHLICASNSFSRVSKQHFHHLLTASKISLEKCMKSIYTFSEI